MARKRHSVAKPSKRRRSKRSNAPVPDEPNAGFCLMEVVRINLVLGLSIAGLVSPFLARMLETLAFIGAPAVVSIVVFEVLTNDSFPITRNLIHIEYFAGRKAVTRAFLRAGLAARIANSSPW